MKNVEKISLEGAFMGLIHSLRSKLKALNFSMHD